jgi:hypothetical protein
MYIKQDEKITHSLLLITSNVKRVIINCFIILLHLFYIDGDIKRYLKELMQKIKYFKIIFFHILFIVIFIYKV